MEARTRRSLAVALEVGTRRVFACALDWPGWCRAGKTEDAAVEALVAYAPRYAPVAEAAGAPQLPTSPRIAERLAGNATTDFGAPDVIASGDQRRLSRADADRHADLMVAAWGLFDDVVAQAPAALRKGPRGGGRDRDAVVDHVLGAEASYARQVGVRLRPPDRDDVAAVGALRTAIAEVIRGARAATPPDGRGWPPRYAARRIAWHVLDHAWEIEDRSS